MILIKYIVISLRQEDTRSLSLTLCYTPKYRGKII